MKLFHCFACCDFQGTDKSLIMNEELIWDTWDLLSMKLENHLFEMFSYKIVIILKQLNGNISTPSDTLRIEITFYDVFAQGIGMLLLITASKTNC